MASYFALRANCLSLGHTHASLDVFVALLLLRRGLEFVLGDAAVDADTFFWAIPGADNREPTCLFFNDAPPVGLVAALLDLIDLIDAIPLLLVALYMLSTDDRYKNIPYVYI